MESPKKLFNAQLCVSRQISACSICRSKKIKCDGLVPVCSPCQRSKKGAECTNSNDKFARGKERSYVTALETRLDRLVKDYESTIGKAQANILPDYRSQQANDTIKATKIQRKEAFDLDALVSDFGILSVNATSRDFDGFTRQMSFAKLILAASTATVLPRGSLDVLPPRHAAVSLIQHYLDHFLIFSPFLTEIQIFSSIEALYESRSAPADKWTIFLIIAVSLLSLSNSPDDPKYLEALRYVTGAIEHAETVLLPGSAESIAMILLLAQYAILDPHHFNSWCLIGAAARFMVDLGYHQDPSESFKIKEPDLERRRRVFHSVYNLDRATSLAHRRAFSFTDDSANVALPRNLKSTKLASANGGSLTLHTIELRQIQSSYYQSLFQSGPKPLENPWPTICAAQLDLDNFAHSIHASDIQENNKLVFRSEILYTRVLLLSPRRLTTPLIDYGQLLILEYAITYAHTISALTSDPVNIALCSSYDLLRTYYVAQRLIDVLTNYPSILASDTVPAAPTANVPITLPQLTFRHGRERIMAAIEGMRLLDGTIQGLGKKYGFPSSWIDFKLKADGMLAALRARARAEADV